VDSDFCLLEFVVNQKISQAVTWSCCTGLVAVVACDWPHQFDNTVQRDDSTGHVAEKFLKHTLHFP
jgi:hypothetical protein